MSDFSLEDYQKLTNVPINLTFKLDELINEISKNKLNLNYNECIEYLIIIKDASSIILGKDSEVLKDIETNENNEMILQQKVNENPIEFEKYKIDYLTALYQEFFSKFFEQMLVTMPSIYEIYTFNYDVNSNFKIIKSTENIQNRISVNIDNNFHISQSDNLIKFIIENFKVKQSFIKSIIKSNTIVDISIDFFTISQLLLDFINCIDEPMFYVPVMKLNGPNKRSCLIFNDALPRSYNWRSTRLFINHHLTKKCLIQPISNPNYVIITINDVKWLITLPLAFSKEEDRTLLIENQENVNDLNCIVHLLHNICGNFDIKLANLKNKDIITFEDLPITEPSHDSIDNKIEEFLQIISSAFEAALHKSQLVPDYYLFDVKNGNFNLYKSSTELKEASIDLRNL